ncbi:MAG TPA: host attachment protein [Hyphomicrobiaceae bacterium]|nr:host attachment protein [Hyphomicrobiaceae bacterium]
MKQIRTWVLIADGRRAQVYCTYGRASQLDAVPGMELETVLPPSREIMADRPGRTFESQGATRHAMERPTDPHRDAKRRFARRIAAAIEEQLNAGNFDKLVVVAPAVTMGDLREELSDQVKARIAGELVADLTKIPVRELPSHLERVLQP